MDARRRLAAVDRGVPEASWRATLPERSRYAMTSALRQTLAAADRWGYMTTNPAKLAGRNPQPPPRAVRAFTRAEVEAIAAELAPAYRPLRVFAAATGLRPEERQALERRDVDRQERQLNLLLTVDSGEVVGLGKTSGTAPDAAVPARARCPRRSARPARYAAAVPLLARRRAEPGQLVAAGLGSGHRGGRHRTACADLRPALDVASDALAAGTPVFELARIMGTSVAMIERHYGTLIDGALADLTGRLDAFDAERAQAAADPSEDV